jgi:hypothetical protein
VGGGAARPRARFGDLGGCPGAGGSAARAGLRAVLAGDRVFPANFEVVSRLLTHHRPIPIKRGSETALQGEVRVLVATGETPVCSRRRCEAVTSGAIVAVGVGVTVHTEYRATRPHEGAAFLHAG